MDARQSSLKPSPRLEHQQQPVRLLGQAAERLLSMHTTTCATERNWSTFGRIYVKGRSRLEISKAEKFVFIKGNHAGSAGKGVDEEVALNHMLEELVQ